MCLGIMNKGEMFQILSLQTGFGSTKLFPLGTSLNCFPDPLTIKCGHVTEL